MRWKKERSIYERKVGEVRIVKKFLWFPLRIGEEVRWLESAVIRQRIGHFQIPGSYDYYAWENVGFETE